MRGLTVREPWASPIVDGFKPVENRSTGFPKNYRGAVLIHASRQWSRRGQSSPLVLAAYPPGGMNSRGYALRHGVPYGGRPIWPFAGGVALGIVDVVDIHPDAGCCRPWGESEYVGSDQQLHRGVTHLVLEDPARFDHPIAGVSGALGLWKLSPILADLVASRSGR